MFQKFFRRSLVLMLVLLAAAFVVPAVAAQSVDTIEIVGTVESMTANTITVNQQVIDISTAQLNTAIQIGSVVKVQGSLAAGGSIVAREVNAPQNGALPGEVEITGILESSNGTTIVVGGQTIEVGAAQIGAGVAVGQMVKVHATATGANTWQAREVSLFVAPPSTGTPVPPPAAGEFEIAGTLEQIGNGFIVISGQNISIAGAELKDALLVGVLVKAHVSLVNGVLVAREVENTVFVSDNTNANDNSVNANDNANANDNNVNANGNDNDDNDNANANDNNVTAAVSMADAIAKVLAVYPNTTVVRIELTTKFGGTLVWEVKTANRVEVIVDANSGAILTIDQSGGGSNGGNGGSNLNNNDNRNDDNANANNNNNSNDNNDDSGGMGGDDSGGDDNGGEGMG